MSRLNWYPIGLAHAVAVLGVARTGTAQGCGGWDARFGGSSAATGTFRTVITWDSDGPGPRGEWVVAGGTFTECGGIPISNIALWDGDRWSDMGGGADGDVNALTLWDPDHTGPRPPQPVAGGRFATIGGVPSASVAMWDGNAWQPLGPNTPQFVYALTTWDPDGDGPGRPLLIAGGDFFATPNGSSKYVASWDGATWSGLLAGPLSTTRALLSADLDGPGPGSVELIAAGSLHVSRWNGAVWTSMNAPTGADVRALALWDPDGQGPLNPRLIAAGSLNSPGGATLDNVMQWDGQAWRAMGSGLRGGTVFGLTTWDRDGDGPQAAQLVGCGNFGFFDAQSTRISHLAAWNGVQWEQLTPFATLAITFGACTWDRDGDAATPREFLVAANISPNSSPLPLGRAYSTDGGPWKSVSPNAWRSNNTFRQVRFWDHDGAGPAEAQLFGACNEAEIGSKDVRFIGRWDGSQWHPLGTGLTGAGQALTEFDHDHDEATPRRLVVGGQFPTAGGLAVNSIASWDGDSWSGFGEGLRLSKFGGRALALLAMDWDAEGPGGESLVVGGEFDQAGGQPAANIALWNGDSWAPFGGGVAGVVLDLESWDPDDEGPLPAVVVVGGRFAAASGVPAVNVASWNGSEWSAFGAGLTGPSQPQVHKLCAWDSDGDGPGRTEIYAGGTFRTSGAAAVQGAARWDGVAWQPLGIGASAIARTVYDLDVWDPDGPGPKGSVLLAAGNFATPTSDSAPRVCMWDGTAWTLVEGAFDSGVFDVEVVPPNGSGLPQGFLAFGSFDAINALPAARLALWTQAPPAFALQPDSASVGLGGAVGFAAQAVNGEHAYRWYRGALPLTDGETASGSCVIGAASRQLSIIRASYQDTGAYTCRATSGCGVVDSVGADLAVTAPPCAADVNGDGRVDTRDLVYFLARFGQSFNPGTAPDFDGNGWVDTRDLVFFLGRFGMACP